MLVFNSHLKFCDKRFMGAVLCSRQERKENEKIKEVDDAK